jgi:hypothetical protein
MGACNFIEFKVAKTHYEAFNELVREATYEHGHSDYNGTISTTTLSYRQPKVIRKRFTEKAREEAYKVAEKDDWGKKWESRTIDCGATKGGHMWAFYGWASC